MAEEKKRYWQQNSDGSMELGKKRCDGDNGITIVDS